MSKPEDFLSRWSRRKLDPDAQKSRPAQNKPPENKQAPAPATPEPEFDISKLPPLESIEATSDISAFLQRGVPTALTHAALRRAWSADPAIRDFVGLSENSWDFNAPDSMPGFGQLTADDVKRFARQLLGDADEEAAARSGEDHASSEQSGLFSEESQAPSSQETQTASLPGGGNALPEAIESEKADSSAADAAKQQAQDANQRERQPAHVRHGRALPK